MVCNHRTQQWCGMMIRLPVARKQHNDSQSPIITVCKQMAEHPTGSDCVIGITGNDETCITAILSICSNCWRYNGVQYVGV